MVFDISVGYIKYTLPVWNRAGYNLPRRSYTTRSILYLYYWRGKYWRIKIIILTLPKKFRHCNIMPGFSTLLVPYYIFWFQIEIMFAAGDIHILHILTGHNSQMTYMFPPINLYNIIRPYKDTVYCHYYYYYDYTNLLPFYFPYFQAHFSTNNIIHWLHV